jgi:ATP-dependent DNA ligase
VGQDETRLVSRRGNVYKRFTERAPRIHVELRREAVLDGGDLRPRPLIERKQLLRSIVPELRSERLTFAHYARSMDIV